MKDRECVEERLLNLYSDSGEEGKLKALEKKLKQEDEEKLKTKDQLYLGLKERITNLNQAVSEKVGRNSPCPCGSGKKYKKCCGRVD